MSKPDGTIIFSTLCDNSELEKQVEDAKKEVESIEGKLKELNKDRTSALKEQQKAQEKLNKAQAEQAEAEKKVEQANELAAEAKERLVAAQEKLNQIQREKAGYDDAKTGSFNPDTASDAQAYVENYKTEDEWNEAIKSAQNEVSNLEKELKSAEQAAEKFGEKLLDADENCEKAKSSVREAKTAVQNIDASISSANSALEEAETNAGNLGNQFKAAEEKSRRLQKPIDSASKSVDKFMKRLKRMALNAAVFSVVAKAFSALKDRLSDAIEQNEEASAAMAQLGGAAKTAAQPIINLLVPALTSLAQTLTRTIVLTGSLFGKDFVKDASDAAQALDKVKKAKQSLAGFDEITIIGNKDEESSSSSYDFNDVISGETANSAKTLNRVIAEAALAVGAILTFSGTHMLLGIALMALGATAIVSEVKDDWTSEENKVVGAITSIETVLAAAMFVIGAILLFSGQIGLGIAAILLGIELTGVAYSFDALKEELQTPLGELAGLMVGVTLVVLGIILCCAQAWALGIGAIVAGASAFIGTVAVNWNAIVEGLQTPLGAAVAVIGGAVLIVLGILLCCAQAWPLGIGLIVAGAEFIGGTVAVNWNAITKKVKEIWQSVKNFWNKNIAPIFTVQWWKNLAIKCGNGLLAGFEGAINGIISMFEKMINWVVGGLNKISFDIPDWVPGIGGKKFGFNIQEASLGRVSIPRLAQGAVLPANQPFLAMVGDQKHGTNVEAPLATIQEAVRTELVAMFGNGFGTIDARLLAILEAIYGIDTSDERYARAVSNYNRREAIMGGV